MPSYAYVHVHLCVFVYISACVCAYVRLCAFLCMFAHVCMTVCAYIGVVCVCLCLCLWFMAIIVGCNYCFDFRVLPLYLVCLGLWHKCVRERQVVGRHGRVSRHKTIKRAIVR